MFWIFLSEAINMPYFNFISWMHDLQWGKLSRSHGSHRIRQDLSALGSPDTTPAQILARKVKYYQIILPMILFTNWHLLHDELPLEILFISYFLESLEVKGLMKYMRILATHLTGVYWVDWVPWSHNGPEHRSISGVQKRSTNRSFLFLFHGRKKTEAH